MNSSRSVFLAAAAVDAALVNAGMYLAFYMRFDGKIPKANIEPFIQLMPFISLVPVSYTHLDVYKRQPAPLLAIDSQIHNNRNRGLMMINPIRAITKSNRRLKKCRYITQIILSGL